MLIRIKMAIHPLQAIGAITHRSATNHRHLRIGFFDRLLEQNETALIFRTMILTANLYIFQAKRGRVSMLSPKSTHCRVCRCIGISDRCQRLIYQLVHRRDIFITGATALAGHTTVNHIDGLRMQIFAQLQILMIAHAVGRAISPYIPEALSMSHITHRLSPGREGSCRITLYETAAGETDKTGRQRVNQRHQIGAQPILAPLPALLREERDHINPEKLRRVGGEGQNRIRHVGSCRERMRITSPFRDRGHLIHLT